MAHEWAFDGIGTRWEITSDMGIDPAVSAEISETVERLDGIYSRFREDSLVTKMMSTRNGATFEFPSEDEALFDLYDWLYEASDGAVDPLVGEDLEWLGYDAAYTLAPRSQPRPAIRERRWRDRVTRHGSALTTTEPVTVDIGAVGKGYLVDRITGILRRAGHDSFIVDGSGDMRHVGDDVLRVGLEHPIRPGRVVGVVQLENAAICASAVNRRSWGQGLHHVIDARTGVPTEDIIATWVVAPDAALADGLATALFFLEGNDVALGGVEWLRMLSNGALEASEGFSGEVFV